MAVSAQRPAADDWQLVGYKLDQINVALGDKKITISVDTKEGRVSGNSGCNRFMGGFKFEETGRLKVGPIAGTMMACPEPWMTFERAFLKTLEGADAFSFETGVLTVTDTDTGNFLRFKPAEKPMIMTWYVNKKVVDCMGAVKTKCLQVKETKDGQWQDLFGPIQGFNFRKDYYSVIEVERVRLPNPAAGASAYEHRLIRIIKQTKKEKEL
jgi:heat shock protein HslJ